MKLVTVANPAAKEQAVLDGQADALLGYFMDQGPRMQLKSGVKMGWTRLYDIAGISTLSSAIIVNNDWLKDPKHVDQLKRFLAASQRGLGLYAPALTRPPPSSSRMLRHSIRRSRCWRSRAL